MIFEKSERGSCYVYAPRWEKNPEYKELIALGQKEALPTWIKPECANIETLNSFDGKEFIILYDFSYNGELIFPRTFPLYKDSVKKLMEEIFVL
jgi:hypothetical protein